MEQTIKTYSLAGLIDHLQECSALLAEEELDEIASTLTGLLRALPKLTLEQEEVKLVGSPFATNNLQEELLQALRYCFPRVQAGFIDEGVMAKIERTLAKAKGK